MGASARRMELLARARRAAAYVGIDNWDRRRLAADVFFASLLGFCGDVICQVSIEGRRWHDDAAWESEDDFNARRLFAQTAFATFYIGGFLHFLYQTYTVAVAAFAQRAPALPAAVRAALLRGSGLPHALACALVDSVHCAFLYVPAYFLAVGVLQGDGLGESMRNLHAEWVATSVACVGYWLPFMCFNFAVVPPARRVQAMVCADLFWDVLVDYLAHRPHDCDCD